MALSDRIMTSGDVINDLHDRIIQDEQLIRQMRDALAYSTDPDHPHYGDQIAAIAAANARLEGTP